MTLVVGDRIQETTTTTGTGTITLLGAVTQFQSFAAGVGNGNSTYYTIADQSGVNWEEGIGTYTTSGSTLTRTVLASSNAGALVNFPAGTKNVFCSYPAEAAVLAAPYAYPTVSPTLNLDFANSATVDPRITFVRNSTATYYDGKTTAMAEQNLLTYSQDFTNAIWTKVVGASIIANTFNAPDGTLTASTLSGTTAYTSGLSDGSKMFYNSSSGNTRPSSLTTFSASIYVYSTVAITIQLGVYSFGGSDSYNSYTEFTLTANTWQRLPKTFTFGVTAGYAGISIQPGANTLYIWGAQLEQRSSATAYTPTTTAAITNYIPQLMTAPAGVPRLDYNPTTGQALGLLIEESRTNLLTYSQDFSNAAWVKSGATIGVGVIAPDGSVSQKITSNASTTLSYLYKAILPAAGGLTFSGYVKSDGICNWVQILISGSGVNTSIARVWVNLITGAVGTIIGGWSSVAITSVGNGWFKASCTTTVTATSGNYYFSNASGNGTDSYTGDGYSGIYIWGAQLEAGSFATSYIPTTSAAVTRTADQASITGTNFSSWYNQAQGSFYCEFTQRVGAAGAVISATSSILVGNDANTRFVYMAQGASNLSMYDGTNITAVSAGGVSNTPIKYAIALNPTTASACTNGLTVYSGAFTKASSTIQLTLSQSGSINGTFKKITYYPQALSSANLQGLTS